MSQAPSFHVRLPKSLHGRVREIAAAEGVSFNTLIASYVAAGVAQYERSADAAGTARRMTAQEVTHEQHHTA